MEYFYCLHYNWVSRRGHLVVDTVYLRLEASRTPEGQLYLLKRAVQLFLQQNSMEKSISGMDVLIIHL